MRPDPSKPHLHLVRYTQSSRLSHILVTVLKEGGREDDLRRVGGREGGKEGGE